MSLSSKGLLLAVIQVALVLSVAGKYYAEGTSLPRAWARAAPYDPNLPIRGRYVRLQIEVEAREIGSLMTVRLSAEDGKLIATAAGPAGLRVRRLAGNRVALAEPLAFFIPEHLSDPSRRATGEELWVEVSVPKEAPPRPIRLGVKKDGVLTPLSLN
jgi:hypothetical protein